MRFNSDKFEHVRHGGTFKSNKSIPMSQYFTDDQELIEQKTDVCDLGVTISATSDFHNQILKVVKSARDKSNWIFRSFYSRDVQFLTFMWKCYLQPILDYASQLWSPSRQLELKLLEDVFRNFSAQAQNDNLETLNFWTRIQRYQIRSQQRCAERFRVICTWKILEGIAPNCGLTWRSNDRSGCVCIVQTAPRTASDRVKTLKDSLFQVKGPKLFNSLPFSIREKTGCSLNSFKNVLDKYLEVFPDMALLHQCYPLPSDVYTGHPSNSIQDWARYFQVSTRVNKHPIVPQVH